LVLTVEVGARKRTRTYRKRDQVASELIYFADCIREGRSPEPSGVEGLADVRVIRALMASADSGRAVEIEPVGKRARPDGKQEIRVAPHGIPPLVHAEPPSRH
jgi:glucose-fructose oxidoreductase